MALSFNDLKRKSLKLPLSERTDLVRELINSLNDYPESFDENAWDNEIVKRIKEIKSGKIEGKPAEQILAEIRAKYQ